MSGKALRVHNSLPGLDKRDENPSKGSFTKTYVGNSNENFDEWQVANPSSVVPAPMVNGDESSAAVGVGNLEVEYIESEDLSDIEDIGTNLSTLLARLDSKDWVSVCEALNHVRQMSIFHKEVLLEMLGKVVTLVVKSLRSPRSAVCKTAIMTSADIFKTYNDDMIDSLDPLLVQLLLKSSQDKRFVCEVAEKTLLTMTNSISPALLLPKLQPYLKHKNPRIRAKASIYFCQSVLLLGSDGINTYGIDKLIQIAASQLSDQLPESREAARTLALELQTVFEKSSFAQTSESEQSVRDSWEDFCHAKLSPLSAQAVLRITSAPKVECLTVDC